MMMKAAVWKGINNVEIEDIPMPSPKSGEVLIRVKSAGVCMTDIHIIKGEFPYTKPPHVLGHEIAGVLEHDSNFFKAGDRVIVETYIGCGTCFYCLRGMKHLCVKGEEIGYVPYQGGYAEYICVPEKNLYKLPDDVSFDEGGILESFMCPFGSLYDAGRLVGDKVLIMGAGPAGLAYVIASKAAGAGKIILAGRNSTRLSQAKSFGADVIIDIDRDDIESTIINETKGIGVDVAIEAAGVPKSIANAFEFVRKGGRVVLYGIPGQNAEIPFPVTDIIIKQLKVTGSIGNPNMWKTALELIEGGRISLKGMVTHKFSLEHFNEAIDLVANKRDGVIKAVINP